MSETVERMSLDLRYESYRMRSEAAEARLLASIAGEGILQPLAGVDTPQGRLLLDGFKLDRKKIMSYYDSFDYMTKQRSMVWLGPTGCGKTGLATAFLLQALDRGHRGYFVTFPQLLQELFHSLADRSDGKLLHRYASYDCLVIDEVGYVEVEPAQVGQFFTLMHKRHKRKTTLITSNLGFVEWGTFLHNAHLTSALIDRLTENCHTINMKDCKSLRDRLDE